MRLYFGRNKVRRICGSIDGVSKNHEGTASVELSIAEAEHLRDTLDELLDDDPPALTQVEKGATVHDLLAARSGVYHPALYETDAMAAARRCASGPTGHG